MKKLRKSLALLENELTVLSPKELSTTVGGSGGDDGYWSWVNGEYMYTYNGGMLGEVVISAGASGTGFSASSVIGGFLTSFGFAATQAEVSAVIAGLEGSGFAVAGKMFGIASVAQNALDLANGSGGWEDLAQIGIAGVVVFGGPYWALGAGIVLATSDIIEMYYEHVGSDGSGGNGSGDDGSG